MSNYYNKYIPSEGPENARIYIVGEAPGEQEHREGRPFIGESGRLLRDSLSRHGIPASECYITNLCHYRPNGNNLKLVLGEQIFKDGLSELYSAIKRNNPNVIVPLGNYPLKYITGRDGIKKWRGSIIPYLGNKSLKCIPTFHPAAILRDGSFYPTFDQDIKRISEDSNFPEFNLPQRQFVINPRGMDLEEWVQKLCASEYLGTDIETIKSSSRILCVGFSPSPEIAICLSTDREGNVEAIRRILADGRSKKIFQFGTFDYLQLNHLNGFNTINDNDNKDMALSRPYFWDTNNYQHIAAPELPRSLEYLTSIYTREPYYKTVGRGSIPDDEKGWGEKVEKQSLYEYNCKDCCCTIEIALAQMKEMDASQTIMMNYEMALLEVALHISQSGMLQDEERRDLLEKAVFIKYKKKQQILNALCQLGIEINVRSIKLKEILYNKLNLPPRYSQKRITTNEDAIVSLIGFCKGKMEEMKEEDAKIRWKAKMTICKLILEIRGLRVLISNYLKLIQKSGVSRRGMDGRIRSTYKVAGTETGRFSASKYVDGSGFNAQTLPRDPIDIDEATLALIKDLQIDEDINDEDEVGEEDET